MTPDEPTTGGARAVGPSAVEVVVDAMRKSMHSTHPADTETADAILEALREQCSVAERMEAMEMRQVAWCGPYGVIPGGLDNDPIEGWQPVYMLDQWKEKDDA